MTETAKTNFDPSPWRAQIPLTDHFIALNNCSHAPQTIGALEAANRYLDTWNRKGMDWEAWMGQVEAARAEFASMINASIDEVAVTTSVSAATAGVASALDFRRPRNRVLVSETEFPSVAHVWQAYARYGAEIDWASISGEIIDTEAYTKGIDDRTCIVSACYGYYQNGYLQDVGEIGRIAHAHGAMIYVDAYQSAGTRPIDVKAMDIDFLSAGSLKYLMGMPGIAFLYVRESLHHQLKPSNTGWFGRVNPFAFDAHRLDWASTARRFDAGTPPIINAAVACAGMSMIREVGLETIHAYTRALSGRLIRRGQERGLRLHGTADPDRRTPSTAFHTLVDSHLVEAGLRERGVLASARGPVIRLAPHFFNTMDEMDRAIELLCDTLENLNHRTAESPS